MLEAQVQAVAPPSAQMGPPMSMFQMYHPSNLPIVPQLQNQQQQPQQSPLAPPQSGGTLVRKREHDGIQVDESGAPIKKRRRRRRRNSAGVLVDGDTLLENGDHHGRQRRPKAPADPNRPKRPASAYLIFQNEVRKDMQAAYPDLPYHEILGKISERWNQLSETEKKHYTDITIEQKRQYEKDKAKYEATKNNGEVPPTSAGSATTAPTSEGPLQLGPISTGLVPVSAGGTSEDADEDEEEASEASAEIQGQEDDEEDDEEEVDGDE